MVLLAGLAAALALAYLGAGLPRGPGRRGKGESPPARERALPPIPRHMAGGGGAGPAAGGDGRPGVLLIIDDLGHNRTAASPFLGFDRPLAMSFLPGRPLTRELAEEAHRRGKTVFLHLPMEPLAYPAIDPGEGCILTSQSAEQVERTLAADLEKVPHAEAVNNHEGSRATEDERLMETLMLALRGRDLAFVDSQTAPRSVTGKVADRLGLHRLERDVFLDNERSPAAIRARAQQLFGEAETRGWAVGIGHPYPETAAALEWMRAEADRRGIAFLTLQETIARADARH
jgi:polysaccharide deacetylase 2 family uncharacterized protein YibQ